MIKHTKSGNIFKHTSKAEMGKFFFKILNVSDKSMTSASRSGSNLHNQL